MSEAQRQGAERGRVASAASAPPPLPAASGAEEPAPYSKDYWDNVFEQIARRPLVKLALAVLALLYGGAIFAPWIANDRPLRLHGIDAKAYGRDLKLVFASAASLASLAEQSEAEYLASLEGRNGFQGYAAAREAEVAGLIADCGAMAALIETHRALAEERAVRLTQTLAASDAELAASTGELRQWLSGLALAALRKLSKLPEPRDAADEDVREALVGLREAMVAESEQLRVRAGRLAALVAGEADASAPGALDQIALAAERAGQALGAGERAEALAAAQSVAEGVRGVRKRLGAALVVSRLPEAGRTLVQRFSGRADALEHLAAIDEPAYLAELEAQGRYRSFQTTVREERDALAGFVDTLWTYVPPERRARLEAFDERADLVLQQIFAGQTAAASELATALKDEAKALRSEYKAILPGETGEGVELRPAVTYPLLETISATEIFFMVLWAFALSWPLWNAAFNRFACQRDRERIRKARRTKRRVVIGTSLVLALVWKLAVGGQPSFDSALYKEGLTKGDIHVVDEARDVLFPPLAMGYAENHAEERFRPPTWSKGSQISEEGYYVEGAQKPEPDRLSGEMPPAKPIEVRVGEPARNSPYRHLLGTDSIGRDIFTRLLYGGRISLAVGLISAALLVFIGVIMGSLAGYFGGRVDIFISRLIEIVQAFPAFFLILTAVALIPEDKMHPIFAIVLFIAIVGWTGVARLVRGEFLRLKDQDFAMAARALGFSPLRVIFRHVLPNALGPVLVAGAFSVASGILTESAISFLGLGIQQPIPSWGSVLSDSRAAEHWWIQVFPGLLIFVTVFCYNVVGEGVRDALDPRRKV